MESAQIHSLCEIYFNSFRIPAGIFDGKGNLTALYSPFGERQTSMYIEDALSVIRQSRRGSVPVILFDRAGAAWTVTEHGEEHILLGPVQTGNCPAFEYGDIPERSYDAFAEISSAFASTLSGRPLQLRQERDEKTNRKAADLMYRVEREDVRLRSFDEVYECAGKGDIAGLTELLGSSEFDEYQDMVMRDRETAVTVYVFSLAKVYHICQAAVPIKELSPLVSVYMEELKKDPSLAALKSGGRRMLYDFTRYVSEFGKKDYSPAVNTALMYIKEHIYSQIKVEDIARHCAVSVSSLQHRFREETGMSISDTILSCKTDKARYFLRYTLLPCTEIAFKMGYCSQSYFIKQFRKATGMTPSEYRAANSAL